MGSIVNSLRLITASCILCLPALLSAGKLGSEKNNLRLEKDILVIQSILNDNRLKANGLEGEITYLEYQVVAAQRIIKLVDREETIGSNEVVRLSDQLRVLKSERTTSINQYQSLLLEEYKNRDYRAKLYFLASSKDVKQLVNRLTHLNTLKEFRIKQLKALSNKQKEVEDKLNVYNGSKKQKESIADKKINEIVRLNEILRTLHQKYKVVESENQSLFIDLQRKEEGLNKALNAVRVKHVKNKKGSSAGDISFSWPVSKGLLVGKFGVSKHAKERKVQVLNNGLDVLVSKDEPVYAVESGLVMAILEVPGLNHSIIVNHGGYYSVYSNVSDVLPKVGDKLEKGNPIAKVAQSDQGLSKLHFELWKGVVKLDPEQYLQGTLD